MFPIKANKLKITFFLEGFEIEFIHWSFLNQVTSVYVDVLYEKKIRRERIEEVWHREIYTRNLRANTDLYASRNVCARVTEVRQYQVST